MSLVEGVSIREMQIDDYDEVFDLWRKTLGMGLSKADEKENMLRFLFRNVGLSYVCCLEDIIIGTVLCGHDGRRGYIYHVTVAEEYRGKGIGRALVTFLSLQKMKQAKPFGHQ